MAKPYSYDLRRKVVEAIELDGLKKSQASELFNISRNTINLWLQRKAETGDFPAKARVQTGHSHKVTDWEKFGTFVKAHSDKTQQQLADLWEGDISARTISRALKKIGFTRKKRCDPAPVSGARERAPRQRPTATVNGMKTSVAYFWSN